MIAVVENSSSMGSRGADVPAGRGRPQEARKEVKIGEVTRDDTKLLKKHVGDFCAYFGFDLAEILKKPFTKIYPYSHRPYGTIYAY